MKNLYKTFILTAILITMSGCASSKIVTYYPNGQIQMSKNENALIGTVNGIFGGVSRIVVGVFGAPQAYYVDPYR